MCGVFFCFFEFFSSMHDKDIFVWLFSDCHLNTKFCSRSLPVPLSYLFQTPCDMISQAVPVIEMMNGLEKPIKTFCYKKYPLWVILSKRAQICNECCWHVGCLTQCLVMKLRSMSFTSTVGVLIVLADLCNFGYNQMYHMIVE